MERRRYILGGEHDLPKANDADARIYPNGNKTVSDDREYHLVEPSILTNRIESEDRI